MVPDRRRWGVQKDGEEKPGMKGLSMTEEQWGILNSHLKQLVWKF